MITESSGDFSLKMEMTNSELENNITTRQKALQSWLKNLTLKQMEQLKNLKFAMGFILGVYNESIPQNNMREVFNQKGPNGERAQSGMVIWVVEFSIGDTKLEDFCLKINNY